MIMVRVEDYLDIAGDELIAEIYRKATPLNGMDVLHINSTYYGGGVAEMLKTLIPLLNDVGIDAGWRVLHGTPDFFSITKGLHNALQGEEGIDPTEEQEALYRHTNEDFSVYTHIIHDAVVIHDPQPLPLIKYYRKRQPWYWRCHIDLSSPDPRAWNIMKRYLLRYDRVILSNEKYRNDSLPVDQSLIYPAIDPLSTKNQDLSDDEVEAHLSNMGIPTDKPIISQISRFDKWKDPLGVIDVFKKIKKKIDCRLVLCGSMASDDPEGYMIYDEVKKKEMDELESGDLIIRANEKDLAINALQRVSSVVIQKSHREGFGLTATEALWKGTPVVCSDAGGLPIQVEDGVSGFVEKSSDNEAFAEKVIHLLKNPEKSREMGKRGKENVRGKFLVPRLVLDHMNLLMSGAKKNHNL